MYTRLKSQQEKSIGQLAGNVQRQLNSWSQCDVRGASQMQKLYQEQYKAFKTLWFLPFLSRFRNCDVNQRLLATMLSFIEFPCGVQYMYTEYRVADFKG